MLCSTIGGLHRELDSDRYRSHRSSRDRGQGFSIALALPRIIISWLYPPFSGRSSIIEACCHIRLGTAHYYRISSGTIIMQSRWDLTPSWNISAYRGSLIRDLIVSSTIASSSSHQIRQTAPLHRSCMDQSLSCPAHSTARQDYRFAGYVSTHQFHTDTFRSARCGATTSS